MFGAFTAFMPLFALILPQKIAILPDSAGGGAVRALSWILVAGGISAGGGNIVAGIVSDALFRRTRSRRLLITVGAATLGAGLAALGLADSFAEIVLAMVAYQLALNLMLSPLVALLVDYVPDPQKGRMAGWLGLALPFGSLMITVLTFTAPLTPGASPTLALTITIIVVLALVAPLLILWPAPPLIVPETASQTAPREGLPITTQARRRWVLHDFMLAWAGRLLVQFAAAAICPYLYFYVADVVRPAGGVRAIGTSVGVLAFAFAVMSVVGALYVGWVSDRLGRRRAPLALAAILVAVSMAILSVAPGWPLSVVAYGGLAAGMAGFLAIDSALVAQLVAANSRRATLLGVMNLTNTLPGLLAPALTLAVIGEGGKVVPMVLVMQVAAGGALIAAFCGSRLRTLL